MDRSPWLAIDARITYNSLAYTIIFVNIFSILYGLAEGVGLEPDSSKPLQCFWNRANLDGAVGVYVVIRIGAKYNTQKS